MTTPVVTGVSYTGTGQLASRTYGNGVTRGYMWDGATRALMGLSASFVTTESGAPQTVFVHKESFIRDALGRITQSTNEVPVADGSASSGQITAECFKYDKFNRLKAAWTTASYVTPVCGNVAPDGYTGMDLSTTAYQATWSYSPAGKITQLSQSMAAGTAVTSMYGYTDTDHPAAVTTATTASGTDEFEYDAAGRMVSRTVNGVTTDLSWDVTSSLTETTVDGVHTVYAYDASGQRVLQATGAQRFSPGTAVAYTPAGQIEDADTSAASTGDVSGTRYYTFGGATVAVRTHDGNLALVLGDEQGSVSVTMPVTVNPDGTMASATVADAQAVTRTSYTPYGQLRGADNLALDRGWLGQVEDRADATTGTGTGLTYLNARYYDPVLARFITPDPLMNPADPATLDPYRYADNNPVVFTDATGLAPNKISDDDAYRKAAPTVAKKTAAVVAVKKATGQMPSSANPGGGKKPSSTAPAPCHSFACGGSAGAPPGGSLANVAPGIFTSAGQSFLGFASEPGDAGPWQLPEPGVMNPAPGPYAPGNTNVPRPWNLDVLRNKWVLNTAKAAPYLDYVVAGVEGYNNYTTRYADVTDEQERVALTVERTVLTSSTGIATAALVGMGLTALVAFVGCPFTAGVTCAVGVAVLAGTAAWIAESQVGNAYDAANEERVRRASGVS